MVERLVRRAAENAMAYLWLWGAHTCSLLLLSNYLSDKSLTLSLPPIANLTQYYTPREREILEKENGGACKWRKGLEGKDMEERKAHVCKGRQVSFYCY